MKEDDWLVIRKCETDPAEVWRGDYAAMNELFEQVSANWTETFLASIVVGPRSDGRGRIDSRRFRVALQPRPLTALMDNVHARRLGRALDLAKADRRVGDPIDVGLILLRELNNAGFDVTLRGDYGGYRGAFARALAQREVAKAASAEAPPTHDWRTCTDPLHTMCHRKRVDDIDNPYAGTDF
jgi:hypothetical protein